MTSKELNNKWKLISTPKGGGLYARQVISSSCKPDLMIGVTSNGDRCVLLKLKSRLKFEFKEEEKENLKTYYNNLGTDNDLVLELKDTFFENLFTDLVMSLYQSIKDITEEDESTLFFINTVRYWSDFLKAKRGQYMSEEAIQGLYGELVYLEYLLDNSTEPVNHLLSSWRGPYDANHDFHFSDKNVEVKTKRKNSNIINIASEHQLEAEVGKELELAVISVVSVKKNGDTLKQILDRIREKTLNAGGLISIISDALSEKKLDFINVDEYESYQFKAESIDVYDCDHIGFPKLMDSQLNEAIHGVTYKLALSEIDKSLITNLIQFNENR
jgi:hypothetical protein